MATTSDASPDQISSVLVKVSADADLLSVAEAIRARPEGLAERVGEDGSHPLTDLVLGDYLVVDVTQREMVDAMVERVRQNYGRIDVLVNNAGITRDRMFLKMTRDDWDAVIDTNLNSMFNVTKQVVPGMVYLDGGSAHGRTEAR